MHFPQRKISLPKSSAIFIKALENVLKKCSCHWKVIKTKRSKTPICRTGSIGKICIYTYLVLYFFSLKKDPSCFDLKFSLKINVTLKTSAPGEFQSKKTLTRTMQFFEPKSASCCMYIGDPRNSKCYRCHLDSECCILRGKFPLKYY